MAQTIDLAKLRDAFGQFSSAMYSLGEEDARKGKPRRSENSAYARGYAAGMPETCACGETLSNCANCLF